MIVEKDEKEEESKDGMDDLEVFHQRKKNEQEALRKLLAALEKKSKELEIRKLGN